MDVVIESKIIEEKFKEAERRSMRRARKIDATQFIRTVWGGPLATHEEVAQMTGIATLHPPVEAERTTVEGGFGDPFGLRLLGDGLTDREGGGDVPALGDLHTFVVGRGGGR